ncbi:hypothetical protein EXIGLDRAFT_728728 [Exidia glandulosa HHB12029]|uniref:Uncharacterized protein n=1 Tax=Exidia glandulosa HHB12029 TaxID=1314781 RepID=A0A165LSJ2_EXIGL|nr:hypothetical protein EXIGLDRAFT_728728 [Exidia glandulosa HHB12029]
MSISFAASGPTSGTFLNPLPQVGGAQRFRTRSPPPLDGAIPPLRANDDTNFRVHVRDSFNIDVVYQTVANRRLAFDNMTWQVPIMALTAHAFLFTIALDAETRPLARYISMILSLIITFLTCRLFIGHMIREVADRAWLQEFENTFLPEIGRVHVKGWRFRKAVNKNKAGWMRPLFWLPAFQLWRDGLVVMGLIAVAVIIVTGLQPELLQINA